MLFRTSPRALGAAIGVAAAAVIVTAASAQVSAPLLIGPGQLGSTATYRIITSSNHPGSAPTAQLLALHWKLGQKVVVMLTSPDDASATPYVATRGADGALVLDNANADDPGARRVITAIGVLNRLRGFVVTAPAGGKAWKTTLVVQPPPPTTPALGVQSSQTPAPLAVPVAATRTDDATGTVLAASGSIDRTLTLPASGSPRGGRGGMGGRGGGGMGGGGMGGGRMGGSTATSGGAPKKIKVTTTITVDAHFDRTGALTSGTIVEASQLAGDQSQQNQQGQSDAQTQPSTRTWEIERAG